MLMTGVWKEVDGKREEDMEGEMRLRREEQRKTTSQRVSKKKEKEMKEKMKRTAMMRMKRERLLNRHSISLTVIVVQWSVFAPDSLENSVSSSHCCYCYCCNATYANDAHLYERNELIPPTILHLLVF